MASVGVSCSICSEYFKNSDTIHSTTCGHVFHEHCIRQWQQRSPQCPSCRSCSSQGHKIYLNFEEGSSDNDKKIVELKSQLEQAVLNASLLQQNLDDSERDFLDIQKQFTEHEERMKELNKQNDYLMLQNEGRVKDIELKTIEIHRLQEALNASSPEGSCMKLQEKINILKEKLQHVSLELTKEIRNSTELAVDKMKLQSMLEHATKSLKSSKERNQNDTRKFSEAGRTDRVANTSYRQAPRYRGCIQSVVIKNIRKTFTEGSSLMNYVLKLIELMNLTLKAEDIQQVTVMERKNNNTVSLLVKFSTLSSKTMFLANKNKLKQYGDTKDIIAYEYLTDNTNSLYHQARTLKEIGYKHVYCKNNRVFVRKDDKSLPIRIERKDDIDDLKRKANKHEEDKDSQNSVDALTELLKPDSPNNTEYNNWLSFFKF